MIRILLSLLWLWSSAGAELAHAQHRAADDVAVELEPGELPPPPPDFATERIGDVVWTYPEGAASYIDDLQHSFESDYARIAEELGAPTDTGPLTIRVAGSREEMIELAPTRYPPPPYAEGVAYTTLGVIVLSLTGPDNAVNSSLDEVLSHELSHIALRGMVGARELPRWFVEGVAIHQSGEISFRRTETLWLAVFRDDVYWFGVNRTTWVEGYGEEAS